MKDKNWWWNIDYLQGQVEDGRVGFLNSHVVGRQNKVKQMPQIQHQQHFVQSVVPVGDHSQLHRVLAEVLWSVV